MIVLFTLAVIAIVLAVDAVVYLVLGILGAASQEPAEPRVDVLVFTTLGALLVIGLSSAYRISSLRRGGAVVARQLGGTPVHAAPKEFAYQRLRNVVEEIAIASGVPAPEIFVMEDETAINAFAAGYTPADAAITVTRGCLDKLTREELQGVIAHEFSHVLNGDMRLNIRLIGVAFGILAIAVMGRVIMRGASRSGRRKDGRLVLIGLGLLVVGYIGVFFARLIKASISRQREFLADASAVQFTRQTEGIAGALKKIGVLASGSELKSHDGEEVAHMLFGDGVGYSALFATHPPLIQRIKRLQPGFDPREMVQIARAWKDPVRVGEVDDPHSSVAGFAPAGLGEDKPGAEHAFNLPPASTEFKVAAGEVVAQVGRPDNVDYVTAASLNSSLSLPLREAAMDRERAMALVLALVLDPGPEIRTVQQELLAHHYDHGTLAEVLHLHGQVQGLHPMHRLPLASLAFPALRRQPRQLLQDFAANLDRLIAADGQVNLQEYCLAKLVGIQVIDALDPAATLVIGRLKLGQVKVELCALFSIVAAYGHDDAQGARRAFLQGMNELGVQETMDCAPPLDWALALDRALPRLNQLAPAGKELVVRGLTQAISADGLLNVAEAELLRTVCAALHCPLPPILQRSP